MRALGSLFRGRVLVGRLSRWLLFIQARSARGWRAGARVSRFGNTTHRLGGELHLCRWAGRASAHSDSGVGDRLTKADSDGAGPMSVIGRNLSRAVVRGQCDAVRIEHPHRSMAKVPWNFLPELSVNRGLPAHRIAGHPYRKPRS